MDSVATTPKQKQLSTGALATYKEFFGASTSWPILALSDVQSFLLGNLPGIVGFGLRALTWPALLKKCGARPGIGRGVQIRNPKAVTLGNKNLIDDHVIIDPQGPASEIELEDLVSIGKFSLLVAKRATIRLGRGANIASHCRIATESRIEIGESALIAAFCYIGPGNHQKASEGTALIEKPMDIKGGVRIGKHVWVGAHSTIMDGVSVGDGAIIGAHSFVNQDVPAGATVAGVPARVLSPK